MTTTVTFSLHSCGVHRVACPGFIFYITGTRRLFFQAFFLLRFRFRNVRMSLRRLFISTTRVFQLCFI